MIGGSAAALLSHKEKRQRGEGISHSARFHDISFLFLFFINLHPLLLLLLLIIYMYIDMSI